MNAFGTNRPLTFLFVTDKIAKFDKIVNAGLKETQKAVLEAGKYHLIPASV